MRHEAREGLYVFDVLKINTVQCSVLSGVDRRQVLSTVDRRPSSVDHTRCPALCTTRRRLGVTQRVARSVGVSQDLYSKIKIQVGDRDEQNCQLSHAEIRLPASQFRPTSYIFHFSMCLLATLESDSWKMDQTRGQDTRQRQTRVNLALVFGHLSTSLYRPRPVLGRLHRLQLLGTFHKCAVTTFSALSKTLFFQHISPIDLTLSPAVKCDKVTPHKHTFMLILLASTCLSIIWCLKDDSYRQ